MRFFIPTKPEKTSIHYWSYTKGHGLITIFEDGFRMKSSYSLPELLNSDEFFPSTKCTVGDGLPCKEIDKRPSSY